MRTILILITTLFLCLTGNSQADQSATKILDKFSSNALGAPSVYMKFKLVNVDQMEKTSDTLPGSIILSKDKYQLIMPEYTVWFNGETSWSFLYAEKEVTITKPEKKIIHFKTAPLQSFRCIRKALKQSFLKRKMTLI